MASPMDERNSNRSVARMTASSGAARRTRKTLSVFTIAYLLDSGAHRNAVVVRYGSERYH